jgi:hypothetical protein
VTHPVVRMQLLCSTLACSATEQQRADHVGVKCACSETLFYVVAAAALELARERLFGSSVYAGAGSTHAMSPGSAMKASAGSVSTMLSAASTKL